jgi:hypothetical protein
MFVAVLLAGSRMAAGQSEFLVYSFPNPGSHGCLPQGSLVADAAGNLYGTTACGGAFNFGVVYELARPVPPKKQWIQRVLYSFTGGTDGQSPMSNLTIDPAGNLYGTTNTGGSGAGVGTVFQLTPPPVEGGAWAKSVLHSFQGGTADGSTPGMAGVVFDGLGNLYGVTRMGGRNIPGFCNATGCGVIYRLTPPVTSGAAWTETVLHFFNGAQGTSGVGTPIFDGKGSLYGMAGNGSVYRLVPPAIEGGAWIYKELINIGFTAGLSNGSLTFHNKGRLYGIASGGQHDLGAVFELVPPPPGGTWTENTIYSFAGGRDGIAPNALGNVVFDKAGNLYGTTQYGGGNDCQPGRSGCGTVFELSPPATDGGAWTETILHSFYAVTTDGGEPSGGLILARNGVLYGVTSSGGGGTQGVVYGVVP